jgi:PAS domain S-box-containing protein
VLVAEDEAALRDALSDLISREPGLELVGAAADTQEAEALAEQEKPDVALLDVKMPGGGGPRVAASIRSSSPATRVLALSAYEEPGNVLKMLRAGAVGYLVKGVAADEILEAIHRASRGQASFSGEVAADVIGALFQETAERRKSEIVLRESEEKFRGLLDAAPDAVVIVDRRGTIVFVNEQTEQVFGYGRDELLGKPIEMLLPKAFREQHRGHRAAYLANPSKRPMGAGLELSGIRKDGSEFPVDISLSAIETDEGPLATAFVRDISERREGELAIRQLAAIVESSDDAIIGKSLDGTIVSWNRGAERMYGYSAAEAVGQPISILFPAGVREHYFARMERLKRGEEIEPYETIRRRRDGVEIDVLLRMSAIRDAAGAMVGFSTIARDVTQVKAQATLERELAERQAVLDHFVTAAEEERRRIAGDIHDDSIQAISAAGLRLQLLRRELDDPTQLALLGELEETIRLSISRLRHLLFELRPPTLDTEGLVPALRMYLEQTRAESPTRFGLNARLRSEPPEQVRVIVYRIAQEALTNIRKHARAAKAEIRLEERDGGYLVRVSDNGCGFAVEETAALPGHLGLAGLRQRAELAGGWVRLESTPGVGTTFEAWIPSSGQVETLVRPGPVDLERAAPS